MPDVRIASKKIWVDDESRHLISGEIHFWRLNPASWRPCLHKMKDIGLNIVSSYVSWQYHERVPGRFDFTGESEPQRNLRRFLDMLAEEDLWLIFRPGPYIYAEWVNMGVPDRVAHYHRLHPEFLKAATNYMQAVVDVARPYLASNGGPIVLFQADNEPEPWTRFYGDQLGLGTKPGPFQEFLRDHYQNNIDALNASWEGDFTAFEQARAVTTPLIQERRYLNRYLDFRRFQYWYSAEIARRAVNTYREMGVDVPFMTNYYPSMYLQNWRDIHAPAAISGPDYYSQNEFRRDSWEHQEFTHLLRYTRTFSALPFSPEFQSGIWHGWHYASGILTARHYRLMALSAMLAGLAGWNWYMLVNRDNWYMAPINEWGRARPELYETFKQIVALYRKVDPPSLEKLTDTAIAFDTLDRSSEIGGFSDPTLKALYQADIDYECYDIATGNIEKPLMFYAGHRWMSRENQQRLRDYVENGGHLVFFDQLPVQDAHLQPLNLLGLHEPDGLLAGGSLTLHLGNQSLPVAPMLFASYADTPGQPITAERRLENDFHAEEGGIHFHLPVGEQFTVGYHEKRGKGAITVMGMPPSAELVLAVHRWLDIPIYCRANSPHISTALFRQGDGFVLIGVNNSDQDVDTVVEVAADFIEERDYRVEYLVSGQKTSVNFKQQDGIRVRLMAKDGEIIRFT